MLEVDIRRYWSSLSDKYNGTKNEYIQMNNEYNQRKKFLR